MTIFANDGQWPLNLEPGDEPGKLEFVGSPVAVRFMRVAGGVTKAWTYQGDNIASVESTTSPTLHSVYSGSGLGGVAERHDVDTAGGGSTTSRFYLYNHRGDVVGVSDGAGNLTSAYDYDAYGSVSQSVQSGGGSPPTDDILFTGKDLDPDTGLYYFNARWYDSESGRWISQERTGVDGPNLYQYCYSNPIYYVDTDGDHASPLHFIFTVLGDLPQLSPYLDGHWRIPRPDRLIVDPFMSVAVDFDFSHQKHDADSANRHGMAGNMSCDSSNPSYQTPLQAYNAVDDFVQDNIDSNNPWLRGFALHAIQDSYAYAHNYRRWEGITLGHIFHDFFPGPVGIYGSISGTMTGTTAPLR